MEVIPDLLASPSWLNNPGCTLIPRPINTKGVRYLWFCHYILQCLPIHSSVLCWDSFYREREPQVMAQCW
jgi:hypothetical protein